MGTSANPCFPWFGGDGVATLRPVLRHERLCCVSLLCLLGACGGDRRPADPPDGGAMDAGGDDVQMSDARGADVPGADVTEADVQGTDVSRADATPPAGVFIVDFETTEGAFAVEVHPEWAPNGAARFRELVEMAYFEDQRFFRVLPGFIAQWGLSGDPTVGNLWNENTITDDPVVESNLRGYITYAQTPDPNSRSNQFFVNYTDNSFLDADRFAPFGRVITGMDAVDAINAEYGESPDQSRIGAEGNAYLSSSFPNLTAITTARIR